MSTPQRIAVAMSGGVDSSVTAALLHAEGHEVVGFTLRLHGGCDGSRERGRSCCTADDVRDAAAVARRMGFAFHTIDARDAFRARVVDHFVAEYARGRTPNPCVSCNDAFKFDLLVDRARAIGATAVATGHFVRIEHGDGGSALYRGRDRHKDQSYFLFSTPRDALPALRFPLGDRTKAEVRALAREFGLTVAEKAESQEICFIPDGDVGGFVARERPDAVRGPGDIVDGDGRTLGRHKGLHYYTVGQRRGLRVASSRRLYVRALDVAGNRLVVGDHDDCDRQTVPASAAHWLTASPPRDGERVVAQIRYRHAGAAGTLVRSDDPARFAVRFDVPVHAAAPGQALVVYGADDDRLLGGGWIDGPMPYGAPHGAPDATPHAPAPEGAE